MIRLYLTVEGQTEAAFATSVLTPHLANFNVFMTAPRFTGLHKRKRGRIPRGGMLNTFGHALADMKTWLKEDKSPEARFTMMVDLYSLPDDYPGYDEGMAKPSGRQQAMALEASLAAEMDDSRFIPYLQVHEYEALVLTDPRRIASIYDVSEATIEALCRECARYDSPEDVNHGRTSHPKYRIQEKVREYDENVAGPLIAEAIGLPTLRSRCPHFGEWLTILESLDSPER